LPAPHANSFRDFTNSFFTLFLIILGDFNFEELRLANDLLGPVLFISYVVIVYLILFNMFLSIIGEAYVRVKEKTSSFEDPFMCNISLGLYARKQRRLRRIERELYGDDEEHVVTAKDIRAIEADLREILGDAEVCLCRGIEGVGSRQCTIRRCVMHPTNTILRFFLLLCIQISSQT